jgi:nicotinamide mononucleotide adenylyltransferase
MSFYAILNELNDYAGQREVVAEEMGHKVYGELMIYSQELKAERKHVSGHTQVWAGLVRTSFVFKKASLHMK